MARYCYAEAISITLKSVTCSEIAANDNVRQQDQREVVFELSPRIPLDYVFRTISKFSLFLSFSLQVNDKL